VDRKSPYSFDNFVGAGEQRRWHGEAECLGRLEVRHQFEVDWLLDRQVGRLCTFENLVDEDGGPTKWIWKIGSDHRSVRRDARTIRAPLRLQESVDH
jgi:hypothetical protein